LLTVFFTIGPIPLGRIPGPMKGTHKKEHNRLKGWPLGCQSGFWLIVERLMNPIDHCASRGNIGRNHLHWASAINTLRGSQLVILLGVVGRLAVDLLARLQTQPRKV
jgi:hypothetical protein